MNRKELFCFVLAEGIKHKPMSTEPISKIESSENKNPARRISMQTDPDPTF